MNINVEVERIENGFIITDLINDKRKTFYPTIIEFIDCQICAAIGNTDKSFLEYDMYGEKRRIVFSIASV